MDKQQANRNRTYDFRCRKSFRTSSGNMISRGQIFRARVSAFHSGLNHYDCAGYSNGHWHY